MRHLPVSTELNLLVPDGKLILHYWSQFSSQICKGIKFGWIAIQLVSSVMQASVKRF